MAVRWMSDGCPMAVLWLSDGCPMVVWIVRLSFWVRMSNFCLVSYPQATMMPILMMRPRKLWTDPTVLCSTRLETCGNLDLTVGPDGFPLSGRIPLGAGRFDVPRRLTWLRTRLERLLWKRGGCWVRTAPPQTWSARTHRCASALFRTPRGPKKEPLFSARARAPSKDAFGALFARSASMKTRGTPNRSAYTRFATDRRVVRQRVLVFFFFFFFFLLLSLFDHGGLQGDGS